MRKKKNWTDDLRDRMSRYECKDVPQGLWDDIESVLDSQPQRRVIPWMKIASVAAAAAVMTALFVMVAPSEEEQDAMMHAAAEKAVLQSPAATEVGNAGEPAVAYAGESDVRVPAVAVRKEVAESVKEEVSSPVKEGVSEPVKEEVFKPVKEEVSVSEKNGISDNPTKRNNVGSTSGTNRLLADYSGQKSVVTHKGRGVSLSMYASNIVSSSSATDGYGVFASSSPMSVRPHGNVANFVNPTYTVAYSNRYANPVTKVDHHQPVSIGLGARYFLNSRWAVETGVTYSMLESETESGTELSYIYSNQKIQYVGVPLLAGYQWIKGKRLSVYTSGGVTAEFGVRGKMDTQCVVEGGVIDKKSDDIKDIPMQWSVGLTAGVQYNILGNLGIYAEPGMVYYIDNGSSLQTSYSEKPLNFRLKVGVRFDLNKK